MDGPPTNDTTKHKKNIVSSIVLKEIHRIDNSNIYVWSKTIETLHLMVKIDPSQLVRFSWKYRIYYEKL